MLLDTIHTVENEDRKLIKMANQANTMLLCLHIYLLLMFVLIFFVVFVDFFLKFVLQTEARLVEAAGKDALTHMNNRRSMQEMMRQLTSDGERQVAFPKG